MEAVILIVHVVAGMAGLGGGLAAMVAAKGGAIHRLAGTTFVIAMTFNAATAAMLGFLHTEFADVMGGALTIYLVATAWMAARRRDGQSGLFEFGAGALAAAAAVLVGAVTLATVAEGAAPMGGVPGFGFAGLLALAAILDLSVVLRRGLGRCQRLARHLWRAHLALFIAVGSFFPGQIQIFPAFVRDVQPVALLFAPALLVIASLFIWLARNAFSGRRRRVRKPVAQGPGVADSRSLRAEASA